MTVTPLYHPPFPIYYSYLHTSPFLLHWSRWSLKWSPSYRGGPVQSAMSWHTVPSTPTGCPHPTRMSWRRLAFRSYSGLQTVEHGNKGQRCQRGTSVRHDKVLQINMYIMHIVSWASGKQSTTRYKLTTNHCHGREGELERCSCWF